MGSGAAEILDIAKDSGHLGTRRSAEVEEEGKIEKKRGIRFVVGRRGTTQRCQCHGSQKTASHPIGSAGTPRPNITPVTVRAKKKGCRNGIMLPTSSTPQQRLFLRTAAHGVNAV